MKKCLCRVVFVASGASRWTGTTLLKLSHHFMEIEDKAAVLIHFKDHPKFLSEGRKSPFGTECRQRQHWDYHNIILPICRRCRRLDQTGMWMEAIRHNGRRVKFNVIGLLAMENSQTSEFVTVS